MFKNASVSTPEAFDAAVAAGKTPKDMLNVYKDWASTYDDQMAEIGWKTPKNVAEILVQVVNPPKNARILDVAAGKERLRVKFGCVRGVAARKIRRRVKLSGGKFNGV